MLNWKVYREKYFGYEIGTTIGILIIYGVYIATN